MSKPDQQPLPETPTPTQPIPTSPTSPTKTTQHTTPPHPAAIKTHASKISTIFEQHQQQITAKSLSSSSQTETTATTSPPTPPHPFIDFAASPPPTPLPKSPLTPPPETPTTTRNTMRTLQLQTPTSTSTTSSQSLAETPTTSLANTLQNLQLQTPSPSTSSIRIAPRNTEPPRFSLLFRSQTSVTETPQPSQTPQPGPTGSVDNTERYSVIFAPPRHYHPDMDDPESYFYYPEPLSPPRPNHLHNLARFSRHLGREATLEELLAAKAEYDKQKPAGPKKRTFSQSLLRSFSTSSSSSSTTQSSSQPSSSSSSSQSSTSTTSTSSAQHVSETSKKQQKKPEQPEQPPKQKPIKARKARGHACWFHSQFRKVHCPDDQHVPVFTHERRKMEPLLLAFVLSLSLHHDRMSHSFSHGNYTTPEQCRQEIIYFINSLHPTRQLPISAGDFLNPQEERQVRQAVAEWGGHLSDETSESSTSSSTSVTLTSENERIAEELLFLREQAPLRKKQRPKKQGPVSKPRQIESFTESEPESPPKKKRTKSSTSSSPIFLVERIVDVRTVTVDENLLVKSNNTNPNRLQYRVRWENYGPDKDDWLWTEDFADKTVVVDFWEGLFLDIYRRGLVGKHTQPRHRIETRIQRAPSRQETPRFQPSRQLAEATRALGEQRYFQRAATEEGKAPRLDYPEYLTDQEYAEQFGKKHLRG